MPNTLPPEPAAPTGGFLGAIQAAVLGTASALIKAAASLPGLRVDRGDGRDSEGKFTGRSEGYGKEAQQQGLDDFEAANPELTLIRREVVARLPDGSMRKYDGLARQEDGTYVGVEVKTGRTYKDANQREFDNQVDSGTPAIAKLDGDEIQIVRTQLVRVFPQSSDPQQPCEDCGDTGEPSGGGGGGGGGDVGGGGMIGGPSGGSIFDHD